jgi:hypothetical protein
MPSSGSPFSPGRSHRQKNLIQPARMNKATARFCFDTEGPRQDLHLLTTVRRTSTTAGEMRLFTLEEANALIPKMEMVMAELQRAGVELRRVLEEVARASDRPLGDIDLSDLIADNPKLAERMAAIERLIGEIEKSGAHFKGMDLGLVDFPAEIDGEVGLLCWQYGEKEIAYWHGLDTGFAGRQPLRSAGRGSILQ